LNGGAPTTPIVLMGRLRPVSADDFEDGVFESLGQRGFDHEDRPTQFYRLLFHRCDKLTTWTGPQG